MTNFLQVTSFDPLIVAEPQGPQGPQGQIGPAGPSGGGVTSIDGQTGEVALASNPAVQAAQAQANAAVGLAIVLGA
jgi:hypothetical protein